MKILVSQLVELLLASKGAKILTLETETQPKMRKTGNPFLGAVKVAQVNCVVNFNYANSVNKQRVREDKEADFEAEPRKWGERIQGTPIVEHKGQYYLEAKIENSKSKFILNGQEIPEDQIQPYLYSSKSSRQGVEKEVKLRDFKLDSVKGIKYQGKHYEIVSSLSEVKDLAKPKGEK